MSKRRPMEEVKSNAFARSIVMARAHQMSPFSELLISRLPL